MKCIAPIKLYTCIHLILIWITYKHLIPGLQTSFYLFVGESVASQESVSSVDDCMTLCQGNSQCAYYNFYGPENICDLLAQEPRPIKVPASSEQHIGYKYKPEGKIRNPLMCTGCLAHIK